MHCVSCQAEFRDEIVECADCGAALAPGPLPPTEELRLDPDDDLEVLLRTPNVSHMTLVRSILDGARIPYAMQGEEFNNLLPLGPAGSGFFGANLVGASMLVKKKDLEAAQALIQEIEAEPLPPEDEIDD